MEGALWRCEVRNRFWSRRFQSHCQSSCPSQSHSLCVSFAESLNRAEPSNREHLQLGHVRLTGCSSWGYQHGQQKDA